MKDIFRWPGRLPAEGNWGLRDADHRGSTDDGATDDGGGFQKLATINCGMFGFGIFNG